jgi:hypothetical protein
MKNYSQRTRLCAGGALVLRQPGGQAVCVNDVWRYTNVSCVIVGLRAKLNSDQLLKFLPSNPDCAKPLLAVVLLLNSIL